MSQKRRHTHNGWGWDAFLKEVNTGKGVAFSNALRPYVAYGIPAIITAIYLKGYYDKFRTQGPLRLICWMSIAVIFLLFVFFCAVHKPKKKAVT